MALLKFELTDQHIALVRNINLKDYFELFTHDPSKDIMYEDFGLILYGKPDGEFDPLSSEQPDWSDEQKEEMDKLFNDIPTALEIMMQSGSFEAGNYKTKHYDRNWRRSVKKD